MSAQGLVNAHGFKLERTERPDRIVQENLIDFERNFAAKTHLAFNKT